jgi:hypothetical protein
VSAHVSFVRETYEEQAAALIDLALPANQLEAVAQNVEAARAIAAPLFALPLPPEIEIASRFDP